MLYINRKTLSYSIITNLIGNDDIFFHFNVYIRITNDRVMNERAFRIIIIIAVDP